MKKKTSFFFTIFLSAIFLIIAACYAERYRSKFFDNKKDLSSYQQQLATALPTRKKRLNTFFAKKPVFTNVKVNVRLKEKTVQRLFTDLEFTAKRSRRFTKIPYRVKEINKNIFSVIQEPALKGKVEILSLNLKRRRLIYRVTGTYDSFMIIRGEMFVDLRYNVDGEDININAYTFIVLSNKYLWESTKIFRIFPDLGKRIDRIIAYNVSNIVRLGRRTALDIEVNP